MRHFRGERVWAVVLTLVAGLPLASAQEKSVRPGINDSFKNPDAGQFVERFEREGREIYDQRGQIVEACRLKPGMAVADVGAGTGLFTRLFAGQVLPAGRVYAVDIAKNFVDHVMETSKQQGISNVSGVVCTTDSVELPKGSVDLAFICDTYHHFEFPEKTMRSLHGALRPNGQIIVIDFRRIEGVSSDWVLEHVRAGQEVVTKEIEQAGFKLIEEKNLLKDNYFLRFERRPSP